MAERQDRRRLSAAQGHRPAQHPQGQHIPEPFSDTDARLAYVAVTRTRSQIDLGGLSCISTDAVAPRSAGANASEHVPSLNS